MRKVQGGEDNTVALDDSEAVEPSCVARKLGIRFLINKHNSLL